VLPSTRQNISSSPVDEELTDAEGASGENMLLKEREKANNIGDYVIPAFPGTVPGFMVFLKTSAPVSRKIRSGTPMSRSFPCHHNIKIRF
jgi:hypothetical protein